jgi:hypothetical protein
MRRLALLTLLGLLAIGGLSSCSNNPTATSMGTMNVQLTDAPGDFDAVNLVVREVSVQHGTAGSWEVLSSQTHTFDLLQLRNGVFATMGLSPLPAGQYGQLRLLLSSGSTVVVGGVVHPLVIPSGMESGLKLAGAFQVPAHGRIDLVLDFDVSRSIIANGDGTYKLKPVIRCVCVSLPDQVPGAVRGTVLPSDAQAAVFVMASQDTVASSLADGSGNFQVGLLAAGTYSLVFHSSHGFMDQTMSNVTVASGQTTNVGTVQLAAAPPPPPPPPPTNGSLMGQISPIVPAVVNVTQGGNPFAQVSVDAEGRFIVTEIPAGSVDVVVHPATGYEDASRPGVSIVAGQTTDLGVIALTPLGPPPPPPPGAIIGQITPAGFPTTLSVMQNGSVVASMDAASDGTFSFPGLAPGTYDVHVHPAFDYPDRDITGVVVVSGQTTDMGQVPLQ